MATSEPFENMFDNVARTVYICGEVNEESAVRAIQTLQSLDRRKGDIKVVLFTRGGDVEAGFAIYDAIRMCKNFVEVVALGSAQSMGAAILQAGDIRKIGKNCIFMIHSGEFSIEGDSDKLESRVHELAIQDESYLRILATRSGLSISKVRALCKRETFLSAEQTVELGFADEIVGDS